MIIYFRPRAQLKSFPSVWRGLTEYRWKYSVYAHQSNILLTFSKANALTAGTFWFNTLKNDQNGGVSDFFPFLAFLLYLKNKTKQKWKFVTSFVLFFFLLLVFSL